MRTKSKLLVGTALLAAMGIANFGCKSPTTPSEESIKVNSATTAAVKKQDLVGYNFFDGKLVVPDTAQGSAFSPYDVPIISVSTSQGKYVEKGEPIIKLTIPGADAATEAAKADASSAAMSFANEKSDQSGPVKEAQKALDQAKAAEQAAKDVAAAGGTADVAAATQTRVDAEAALASAKQQLRQALQPSKEMVTETAAQLAAAREDAMKGLVRAPISGTIVSMDAKPGMTARSGQSLAHIINFEAARVQGTVPADMKDQIVKGAHVMITMDGPSADPLDGRVTDVSVIPPTPDRESPGYLAVIRFDNPRQISPSGTGIKRIGIKTGSVENALVVPVGAIILKEGKPVVYVQSGSDWIEKPVETGISDGALTEIKSGLNEGDVVRVGA